MAEISIPFKIDLIHGEIQKTVEKIDDIKAILNCIWCCYKANINQLLNYIGLFTINIGWVSCLSNDLKPYSNKNSEEYVPDHFWQIIKIMS